MYLVTNHQHLNQTKYHHIAFLSILQVVFDSDIDNWSRDTSVFNERIIGKKQLVFLIEEEEDGEIFGYYLNTKIVKKYGWQKTDSKTFQFNLQSKNNRLKQPMKFEIKDLKWGGIWMYEKSDSRLINFGDIDLKKENDKNKSYCCENKYKFDYHGIENALCGKTNTWRNNGNNFTLKRILVIQMK